MIKKINIPAFTSRDFRLYFAGNIFALQALWIQRITIAWLAWDMSGSASFVGWVAFLGFAPTIFIGPIFGVLVDRSPVRKAAMMSQGALAVVSLAMAILHGAGMLGTSSLAALTLAVGICTAAHHPVRMSLAPLLAPPDAIPSVIRAASINFNLARTIGPALGGMIVARYGVGAALWVVVAFSIPFQVILPFLSPRARAFSSPERLSVLAGLADGFRLAWRSAFMRAVLLTTLLFALVGRGLQEILPLIADGVFGLGPAGLGTLTSAAGVGALSAAGLSALLPAQRAGQVPMAGRIAAGTGVALSMVIVLSTVWPVTVVAMALLGGCSTVVGISMQSALQLSLADDYRGRVMSLWVMTGIGGSAIGALVLGLLADLIGLIPAVMAFGGAAGALLLATPRLTR